LALEDSGKNQSSKVKIRKTPAALSTERHSTIQKTRLETDDKEDPQKSPSQVKTQRRTATPVKNDFKPNNDIQPLPVKRTLPKRSTVKLDYSANFIGPEGGHGGLYGNDDRGSIFDGSDMEVEEDDESD